MAAKKKTAKKEYAGPCDLKRRKWCPGMAGVIQHESSRKGIVALMTFNLTAGYTGELIVYKKSATDRGLILNLCPWCGANLEKDMPLSKGKKKATKKAGSKKK